MLQKLLYHLRYLSKPSWDTGIPAPELLRALAELPPGRALDLGCGTGTNVRCLVEHGWQATGIDFIPRAIRQARRRLAGLPATLLVADVTRLAELPLPGPYDLALDMGCFHGLTSPAQEQYAAGLRRWLRPGARYLLYAWQTESDRSPVGLSRPAVEAVFAQGFRLTGYEQGTGRPSAWYYFERT